ncbi:UNVERIFIED_CONTAM: hypothetical protein FKN15_050787 [Acipenser sinensis]
MDSYVMAFDGDDMVAYRFKRNTMKTLKDVIALNFKTLERDGLLLHGEGPQGDFLTLELVGSKLVMHISLGSSTVHDMTGHTSVTLGNLLDNQHWHYVTIHRYGNYVNLTLDGETASIRCNGDFLYLNLDKELYIGGVIEGNKPHLPNKHNFRGCMENVFYNGVNIIDLAKNKMPQIRFPHRKKKIYYACQDLLLKPMTFAGINNYLQVPGPFRRNRMSVKFKFRSWDATGLLMYTNFADNLGSLKMALSEGQVNISIAQPRKKPLAFAAGYRLNDGFWHSVDLVARDNFATVIIDEEEGSPLRINNIFTLRTGDRYFFGGEWLNTPESCPFKRGEEPVSPKREEPASPMGVVDAWLHLLMSANGTGCVSDLIAFHGCMQQLYIDSEPVDLDIIMQRRLGRYSQLLLGTCGITDRCTPNLCEHEGKCIQSWDDFICNCDNTGYKGEVCHKSVYKESCEAYRLSGKYYSGNYTIDPDGSGPLKPFVVYCNMQENKAWSVVRHNREYGTKVTGTSMERPFVGDVQYYNASWGEVSALANGSEYCEQRIQYDCYKSRLLNTPTTTELLFIFSVGDGIINATLKSPNPLNDDQWHFVKAEINVKMARIKVDEQPWVVRRFPSQSYVNLVFTKPLLVGAAEYKMRGFLGCLRGLRMNGVTLNLEGKVNELEGIKYNCSGHCWNTSEVLCRNAGRCVEKYSTYLCDCNETAFDGLYCHKGSLDLRYRLGLFINKYTLINRNMADGDPHIVNVTRNEREIRIEVDYMQPIFQSIPLIFDKKFDSPKSLFLGRVLETGVVDPEIQKFNTPGFTGCMSGVKFNNIAPLKAYFRPNQTDLPITIMGELVESNCGAGLVVLPPIPLEIDPWYTGPVIVMLVLLVVFGTVAALYLYLYHYKGSYHTNEPKAIESPSSVKPLTEEAPKKEQNLPKIQEEDRGE